MKVCINGTQHKRLSITALSIIMLNVSFSYCNAQCRYAKCHYADCHDAKAGVKRYFFPLLKVIKLAL